MRRLLAVAVLMALALGVGILYSPAQSASDYRVDVIFDDSQGLIPGQNVQIAGAKVGTINDVVVTDDFKARIKMNVDGEFRPFKTDAKCTIRPQGLIAEYYVDCDPGSPDGKELESKDGEAPTVPVKNTEAPVAVQELFNIWTAPVRDRLGLLLNTVGIGTAGLGSDFNEILRRANPALKEANKVIGILRRQKAELGTILDRTDTILDGLADNGRTFERFVDETDRTTQITGERRAQLADSVRRLPGLLDALEPAMRDLNVVVTEGLPVVKGLRAAAPSLNSLNANLGPFAREVRPTISALRPVLRTGATTLTRSAPLMRILRSYSANSLPSARLTERVFESLRDRGAFENLLGVFYNGAAATARFDEKSHLLPAYALLNPCAAPAEAPVEGCSAKFSQAPAAAQSTRATPKTKKRAAPEAPAPKSETPKSEAPKQSTPLLPADPIRVVTDAVDKVLDRVSEPGRKILGPQGGDADGKQRDGLLGFLLG